MLLQLDIYAELCLTYTVHKFNKIQMHERYMYILE